MKIVTSGLSYLDIDGYAACIAYAELLNLQGVPAVAMSSAVINNSVSGTVRSWGEKFDNDYKISVDDSFIVLDISDPDNFDKIVDINKVEEVVDHHIGFEKYWQDKLSDKAEIDFIGSVCTIIFERWVKSGLIDKISKTSAQLLITGILDNTLNFGASITNNRDRLAYDELIKYANLPNNWPEIYFNECQNLIFDDIEGSIIKDLKYVNFKNIDINNVALGQIVVWAGEKLTTDYIKIVSTAMNRITSNWLINIVSLNSETSYFLCENKDIQDWVTKLFSVNFNQTTARLNKLWLRKEIVKYDNYWNTDND